MASASPPGRPGTGALGRLGALVLVVLVAAACGTTSASRASSTTATAAATVATTTTTTTTLPTPVRVLGTGRTGAGTSGGTPGPTASFGTVRRVLVAPVPVGATATPTSTTSLPDPPGTTDVAFEEVGSGPDLLLVPGEHASMSSWDPGFVQALATHYTVVLFDPPAVGYSAPDPAVHSVEALADVTAGLVDALGLSDPTVLGWGLGGQVALSLAERHPGLATRLVLVDTTAGGPKAPAPAPGVAALLASPSATTAELVALELSSPAARTALLERMAAYAPDDLTAAAIRLEAAIAAASFKDPAVAAGLSKITAPALVVTGETDRVVPPASSTALVAGLSRVHQLTVHDAGYGVLTTDQTRVVAAIEAFTG